MSDLDYVKLVLQGLHLDGRLDGLILNHGTFGSCLRIKDIEVEDWESTFRINVSSCVALVSVCIRKLPRLFLAILSYSCVGTCQHAHEEEKCQLTHVLGRLLDQSSCASSAAIEGPDSFHIIRCRIKRLLLMGRIRRFESHHQPSCNDFEE